MYVQFINPVITLVLNVMSTMAHLEPKTSSSIMRNRDEIIRGKNITGLMGKFGKKGSRHI